ncbi:hypothetical protein INT44_006392, partial [Umbelopsis vinacea]
VYLSCLIHPSQRSNNTMKAEPQSDEYILQSMGYKQELKRSWSLFQNFCLCFSVMSIFVGIAPLYGTAMITGTIGFNRL